MPLATSTHPAGVVEAFGDGVGVTVLLGVELLWEQAARASATSATATPRFLGRSRVSIGKSFPLEVRNRAGVGVCGVPRFAGPTAYAYAERLAIACPARS